MPARGVSEHRFLRTAGKIFGLIVVGFGINAMLRPENALTAFEWTPPKAPVDYALFNNLMIIYGIRDIFMGLSLLVLAFLGDRTTLGWLLILGSGVAFGDGAVCWASGKGQWNHWGYAPMLTVTGIALLGSFDKGDKTK